MRCLNGITDLMDINLSKPWEKVEVRGAWQAMAHGVTMSRTQLSNCTTMGPVFCDLTKALKFHPPTGTFSLSYCNEKTHA